MYEVLYQIRGKEYVWDIIVSNEWKWLYNMQDAWGIVPNKQ